MIDNWSYTWVRRWNQCQLQFYFMKHAPEQLRIKDVMSDAANAGIQDHETLERLVNTRNPEASLPEHLEGARKWLRTLCAGDGPAPLAEVTYDLDERLKPVDNPRKNWRSIWLRLRIDAMRWNRSGTKAVVIDWKTGKSTDMDDLQLQLYPAILFQLYPDLEEVTTGYVFTRSGKDSFVRFHRDQAFELWEPFREFLEAKDAARQSSTYRHNPGFACKWCPAKQVCPAGER